MLFERLTARAARASLVCVIGLGFAGCGGLDPVATFEQTTDPGKLYLELVVDHHAVNLSTTAPYNTIQLTATPRNALGEPIAGLPAPTFFLNSLGDSTKLSVTPDGMLTGLKAGNKIMVIADLALSGNTRHADTMQVNVKSGTPPQVARLSFEPVPPDSTAISMVQFLDFDFGGSGNSAFIDALFALNIYNVRFPFAARVLDNANNLITGLSIEYRSLDPTIANVAATLTTAKPSIRGLRPGQALLEARTTAYGVTVADTVAMTVTWPALQVINVVSGQNGAAPKFLPNDVRVTPYAIVIWQSQVDDTIDVTFDDPTNVAMPLASVCQPLIDDPNTFGVGPDCGTGNLLVPSVPIDSLSRQLRAATTRVRQFPVPGVYTYRSVRTGASGRIIVTADPDPTALP